MEASWLEISLVVDGELAEAVSEVLSRFAPGGVAIESTAIAANNESEGHPVGPLRVAGYLPVNEQLEETRQRLEEALWYLGRIKPLPEAKFRLVRDADWAEAWKQHYHPISIGEKLVIVPAWLEPTDRERLPIRMDPGMAFGTGTHPTTQLCLETIEDVLLHRTPQNAPRTVIDLGCGSGILSVAALKLGAARALGLDIDSLAISVAEENAALNGVAEGLELGVGSLAEVRSGAFSMASASLVVANILAPVLVRMLNEGLGELLVKDGVLVLSGILDEQAGEVETAAGEHGLRLVESRQEGDWVALSFMHERS